MKLFRSINRYFRDACRSVFRNFPLSLASISCITITLIVVAISLVVSLNVKSFTESIKKDVTIVVFVNSKATDLEFTEIYENGLKVEIIGFENGICEKMFNKMNSPVDGPSNNPISGPFGGDVGAYSCSSQGVGAED